MQPTSQRRIKRENQHTQETKPNQTKKKKIEPSVCVLGVCVAVAAATNRETDGR